MKLFRFFTKKNKLDKIFVNGENNTLSFDEKDKKNICISCEGSGNTIIIKKMSAFSSGVLHIDIFGDNNFVEIDEGLLVGSNVTITIGHNSFFHGKVESVSCLIKKNVLMEDVFITTYNSFNRILIGEDCMFSLKVCLYNTDGHPVYQKSTGNLLNYVSDMTIGDSCWIGYQVSILKNVSIAEGTIVGWGSVVTKSIDEPFCAIGGNPAKIIKHDVSWKRSDSAYVRNLSKGEKR